MLTTGTRLLEVASEHDFAVPAFNISDWAMSQGIFEISEELQAPLIIAIHPDELTHTGIDFMPAVVQRAHKSSVPVAIHLDHGTTYQHIVWAIQNGFTTVMMDGSMLPFEENIALTKRAVEAAHAVGLSVEAELGTIGRTDLEAEAGAQTIIYTDPEDAVTFVRETGVDSLAVAIGTCHGIYPAWMKPELKLDLLKQINDKVSVPLVLHGGSGNPDPEIASSVKLGINKINISSDIKVAYHEKMREVLQDKGLREPLSIQPPCVAAMKETAAHKIDLFDARGRAALY
jgi:fructose-bisphosphate aldolase, class II